MSADQDAWYISVHVVIDGELRGFSSFCRYRPRRNGETVPKFVNDKFIAFVRDCGNQSDLLNVAPGADHPRRQAFYEVRLNGEVIVKSFACWPVKPDVLV